MTSDQTTDTTLSENGILSRALKGRIAKALLSGNESHGSVRDFVSLLNYERLSKAYQSKEDKIRLTRNELVAYRDLIIGRKVKDTAADLGVTKTTVVNYRNKVRPFLQENFDIDTIGQRLSVALPLAIESLLSNLAKHDVKVTLAYFKNPKMFTGKNPGPK